MRIGILTGIFSQYSEYQSSTRWLLFREQPQNGHTEISISKTRFSLSAQLIGAVGERRVTEDSAGIGVAVSHRFLRTGFP
jgi:hypothetical protein